jgi:hypothetical protein
LKTPSKDVPGESMVKGKKFSAAVTEERDDLWNPWDESLTIGDSALPETQQRIILKDWLLSNRPFVEVCLAHGMLQDEAERLESKLPDHIVSLKKAQQIEDLELTGLKTDNEKNRQIIVRGLNDGLIMSRQIRVMTDLLFQSGDLTPLNLSRMVGSWDKVLHRMSTFLTKDEVAEDAGFRAMMQMTREELGDLRSKIKEYRHYKVDIEEAEFVLEEGNANGKEKTGR